MCVKYNILYGVSVWDEASHFSELEAVHVGGKLDNEECGVVVIGNRMDIQVTLANSTCNWCCDVIQ